LRPNRPHRYLGGFGLVPYGIIRSVFQFRDPAPSAPGLLTMLTVLTRGRTFESSCCLSGLDDRRQSRCLGRAMSSEPAAGGRPEREIRHGREGRATHDGALREPMRYNVEKCAQDPRSRALELSPELSLGTPWCVVDRRQGQDDHAIGEVRPPDHVLDAVEEH